MPPIIKQPLQKKIMLDAVPSDLNPERDMYATVRQATQREVEARAELFAESTQRYLAGETAFEVKQRYSYAEQQRKEAFLVLADCNVKIEDEEDEKGYRDLFIFSKRKDGKAALAMTEAEFRDAWGLLPAVIAEAIHDAVLQVNPQWDPNGSRS